MDVVLNATLDRQRVLWVATCKRFPELFAEARTVDALREKIPGALELANLPVDAKVTLRLYYDHGDIGPDDAVPHDG